MEQLFPDIAAVCLQPGATIRRAMEAIDRLATGIALVVDGDGRLIETVSDGDIRRAILAGYPLTKPVSELATLAGRPSIVPFVAPASTSRAALLELMARTKLLQIPLVDAEGRVVDLALLKQLSLEPERPIEAVIMAGGFGKRLRPLTEDVPKPMLPVGGRPLLEITLEQLRLAGIRSVTVTTHYLPEKITGHFGDGSRFGVDIRYVQESKPMGTAGALSLLERAEEPMLVVNGDVLTDLDYRAMRQFHAENRAAATVAVAPHEIQIPYGVVEHDGSVVTGISEKPVIRHFVNAGIYLIEPRATKLVPRDAVFNMTDLVERLVRAGERVVVFPVREYWVDVGQHADYQRVQQDISQGALRSVRAPIS